MARAPIVVNVSRTSGVDGPLTAVSNADTVYIYEQGTTTPVSVYAAPSGGSPLTAPFTTDDYGRVIDQASDDLWVEPDFLDIVATDDGDTYTIPYVAGSAIDSADLANHLADTADAHDASAISFAPAGTIAATDVQNAIVEAASEAGGSGSGFLYDVTNATYGATGDGTTDDTAAIQDAIDAVIAAGGDTVYFPEGTYLCNELVADGNNVTLMGVGWGSILKQISGAADGEHLIRQEGTGTTVASNRTGLVIRDLQMLGRADTDTDTQYVHLVAISGVSDVLIDRVLFKNWRGDAVYVGSGLTSPVERHNERVHVVRSKFDGGGENNRNGVSIIDGTQVSVLGCDFLACTASNRPGPVDVEPNSAYNLVRHITVCHNTFKDTNGNAGTVGVHCAALGSPTADSVPHDVLIGFNHFNNVAYPLATFAAKGIHFFRNTLSRSGGFLIGYDNPCRDIWIEDNSFDQAAYYGGRVFQLFDINGFHIRGNVFNNCGLTDNSAGSIVYFANQNNPDSANVTLHNNEISGTGITAITEKHASHTLNVKTNRASGNRFGDLGIDGGHFIGDGLGIRTTLPTYTAAASLTCPADVDVFVADGTTSIANILGAAEGKILTLWFSTAGGNCIEGTGEGALALIGGTTFVAGAAYRDTITFRGVTGATNRWVEIARRITDPSWTAPTLGANWSNYGSGYETAGYYKDDAGIVRLRGLVKSNTTSDASTIFTLPSGFRPALAVHMGWGVNDAHASLEVTTAGIVKWSGGNTGTNVYCSLSGVTFRIT